MWHRILSGRTSLTLIWKSSLKAQRLINAFQLSITPSCLLHQAVYYTKHFLEGSWLHWWVHSTKNTRQQSQGRMHINHEQRPFKATSEPTASQCLALVRQQTDGEQDAIMTDRNIEGTYCTTNTNCCTLELSILYGIKVKCSVTTRDRNWELHELRVLNHDHK